MPTLHIPEISEKLRLTAPWEFPLFFEYRNRDFAFKVRTDITPESFYHSHGSMGSAIVTLPAGTVLRVDRIYIRRGLSNFSSITFTAVSIPGLDPKKRSGFRGHGRFWAKLADCNEIEYEVAT